MFKTTATAAILALALGGSAFAQGQSDNAGNQGNQAGLVNVTVQEVGNDNEIIDETVVQVPVGIAAQVCDISANVIAKQKDAGSQCEITQEQATEAGIGG